MHDIATRRIAYEAVEQLGLTNVVPPDASVPTPIEDTANGVSVVVNAVKASIWPNTRFCPYCLNSATNLVHTPSVYKFDETTELAIWNSSAIPAFMVYAYWDGHWFFRPPDPIANTDSETEPEPHANAHSEVPVSTEKVADRITDSAVYNDLDARSTDTSNEQEASKVPTDRVSGTLSSTKGTEHGSEPVTDPAIIVSDAQSADGPGSRKDQGKSVDILDKEVAGDSSVRLDAGTLLGSDLRPQIGSDIVLTSREDSGGDAASGNSEVSHPAAPEGPTKAEPVKGPRSQIKIIASPFLEAPSVSEAVSGTPKLVDNDAVQAVAVAFSEGIRSHQAEREREPSKGTIPEDLSEASSGGGSLTPTQPVAVSATIQASAVPSSPSVTSTVPDLLSRYGDMTATEAEALAERRRVAREAYIEKLKQTRAAELAQRAAQDAVPSQKQLPAPRAVLQPEPQASMKSESMDHVRNPVIHVEPITSVQEALKPPMEDVNGNEDKYSKSVSPSSSDVRVETEPQHLAQPSQRSQPQLPVPTEPQPQAPPQSLPQVPSALEPQPNQEQESRSSASVTHPMDTKKAKTFITKGAKSSLTTETLRKPQDKSKSPKRKDRGPVVEADEAVDDVDNVKQAPVVDKKVKEKQRKDRRQPHGRRSGEERDFPLYFFAFVDHSSAIIGALSALGMIGVVYFVVTICSYLRASFFPPPKYKNDDPLSPALTAVNTNLRDYYEDAYPNNSMGKDMLYHRHGQRQPQQGYFLDHVHAQNLGPRQGYLHSPPHAATSPFTFSLFASTPSPQKLMSLSVSDADIEDGSLSSRSRQSSGFLSDHSSDHGAYEISFGPYASPDPRYGPGPSPGPGPGSGPVMGNGYDLSYSSSGSMMQGKVLSNA
jgi:hypothetical protein